MKKTGFDAVTEAQWRDLVAKTLKGADFEKLISTTADGIRIEPLYAKAGDVPALLSDSEGPWKIGQRVDHPDLANANRLALEDLEGAADTLTLVMTGTVSARGFGLRVKGVEDLDLLLDGIELDLIALRIEALPRESDVLAALLARYAKNRGLDLGKLVVNFGLSPIGNPAHPSQDWREEARFFCEASARMRKAGWRGRIARIDTRPYHEAGASEAQELAAALATGIAALRAFEMAGVSLEEARGRLSFLLVANADQFMTMAKFRAFRQLWSSVEKACGLTPQPTFLEAETSWRMASRRDPWVNLLRGTVACLAAGLGGADGITVLPFTIALGLPDAFARRLARNTSLILIEEANLWRVDDPAAGSGALEGLTQQLCEKAWSLFQDIEAEGGIGASLAAGIFQGRIAEMRARRKEAVATGLAPLTGTSAFVDSSEEPVDILMPSPHPPPEPSLLPSFRDSEPFEEQS